MNPILPVTLDDGTAVDAPPIGPNRGSGPPKGRVLDLPGEAPDAVPVTVKGGSISRDFLTLLPDEQTAPLVPSFSPAAVDLSPGFGTESNSKRESVPLQQAHIAMRPGFFVEFESPGYLLVVSFLIGDGSSVSYIFSGKDSPSSHSPAGATDYIETSSLPAT